ncbi:hypothetical protein E4U39_007056 [Claviceps sp. Clav50 group G5]|nr:hypothetical protein E4U39_007056 [Claviceps sp. Clav50 group G5]
MVIGFVITWIPPIQHALNFAQPSPTFVGFLVAELLLYCVEVQIVKMIYIKIFKTCSKDEQSGALVCAWHSIINMAVAVSAAVLALKVVWDGEDSEEVVSQQ